jgi:pimeloyl-ACP methyl ester carboxylesterase
MRGLLSDHPLWETFGSRPLAAVQYGGADIGEVTSTIDRIGDDGTDRWYQEWTVTASRLADIGDAATTRGHRVSAREAYLRAASYFSTAWMPLFGAPVDPRVTDSFARQVEVFERAAALMDPPLEVLELPFEGRTLPAYFVAVDDTGVRRPTVVHTNGYDSNLQEMYFAHAPAAVRRGYNVLLFDGPGQGRNLVCDGIPIRPDWETVVTPVIDYVLTRPDVDPDRVVLAGWSFGGFLAPRAAAFEPRIAALVADPGQWDQRDVIVSALPLSDADKARFPDIDPAQLSPLQTWLNSPQADPLQRWRLLQRGPWVHGKNTLYDYLADLCRFELSPVAVQIRCPTLLTMAEGDPIARSAPRLLHAISAERRTLMRFSAAEGAGGHCEGFARLLYHQRTFDWLDETLA